MYLLQELPVPTLKGIDLCLEAGICSPAPRSQWLLKYLISTQWPILSQTDPQTNHQISQHEEMPGHALDSEQVLTPVQL